MFARQKETMLGMTFAEIQTLVFGVIKKYYDKKGKVKTWMWTVAKNELISYLSDEADLALKVQARLKSSKGYCAFAA